MTSPSFLMKGTKTSLPQDQDAVENTECYTAARRAATIAAASLP
jgi:hypothetical protein